MDIKRICCIGAGFVGGPTMAVIALNCPEIEITVVDNNPERISAWNNKNLDLLPVYEPGLKDIIKKVRGKNLFFSDKIDDAIISSQMIFMAVNTPTKIKGKGKGMAADLTFVEKCAYQIGKVSKDDKIIVEKSTLPVRTAERIKKILESFDKPIKFQVISNPEFLAEGTAINDLFKSDRVLIGGDSTIEGKKAVSSLVKIYSRWIKSNRILLTNVWSSELIKLASNAMLAQRISSINALSAFCEKTGANIEEVSKGIGLDSRIGPKFLKASVGFGGSCFKKDILNLVYLCEYYNLKEVAEYWHQVVKINDYQKNRFSDKIIESFNSSIKNKIITVLGWAFKKDTNDSRESASIYVTEKLLGAGAKIKVYDPMIDEKRVYSDLRIFLESRGLRYKEIESKISSVSVYSDYKAAISKTNAIAILTEWDEFKSYNWKNLIKKMSLQFKIFDGRNIINSDEVNSKIYKIGIT